MSFNIEVEGGKSVRLPTAGKYCDRDIVVTAKGESITYPVADEPETLGQMACLQRAKQMRDITYTPVADLPWGGVDNPTTMPAGTPITGIPYSSVRLTDNFIGFNKSIYSWLSAIRNPKADIYTKQSAETIAETWWGVNCSVFVSFVYGWNYHNATAIFPDTEGIEEIAFDELQLCDAACYQVATGSNAGGHVVIITGIKRNEDGSIHSVEITEAAWHKVSSTTYLLADFQKFLAKDGYKLYRNTLLYRTPFAYDAVNDEPWNLMAVDSDLNSTLGNKFCMKTTDVVTINPLVSAGYTGIELYKDGELLNSYSVGDVELSSLAAGKYTAVLVPEGENSRLDFIVVEVTASRGNGRYNFSGIGATPVRVVFKNANGYTQDAVDLTADEIARGYKDIDISAEMAVVPFKCEYGFVTVEAKRASRLPVGYQEVAYIQTDGKQYIDTGVNASNYSSGISYEFKGNATGVTGSDTDYLFGASANGVRSGNVNISPSQIVLLIGATGNDILQRAKPANGADFTLVVGNTSSSISTIPSATVNEEELIKAGNPISTGAMPNANIWLLACNGISGETRRFYGKLYSFKMTDANSVLIRDFVPCYRKSDNAIGLYDLVGGAFYTNAGAGSFTKGADV